jgi:hypothetical protein
VRQRSVVTLVGVVAVFGVLLTLATPAAGAAHPTATITPSDAARGDTIRVELEGWPAGAVTVSVCGNSARRGSEDCDLIGAEAVGIRRTGVTGLDLKLTTPPVPCRCVIRVSTNDSQVVQTIPINLVGFPNGPDIPAQPLSTPKALAVGARLRDGGARWPASWLPVFAGPTKRELVLTLRNRAKTPLTGLRIVAAVGRDASSGEPLESHRIGSLAPGQRRTVVIPVNLSVPAWGHYVVAGRVYGFDAAVPFRVRTANDPWGWELLLPLGLLVAARLARRRERRADGLSEAGVVNEAAVPPELLQRSSPDVGTSDEERSPAPVYDPGGVVTPAFVNGNGRHHEHAPVAAGSPNP